MTTSTRFSQYGVLLAREPASFWRERVIAVVKTERKNRKTCALELSPLFLVFPPFDFQNGGALMRI